MSKIIIERTNDTRIIIFFDIIYCGKLWRLEFGVEWGKFGSSVLTIHLDYFGLFKINFQVKKEKQQQKKKNFFFYNKSY